MKNPCRLALPLAFAVPLVSCGGTPAAAPHTSPVTPAADVAPPQLAVPVSPEMTEPPAPAFAVAPPAVDALMASDSALPVLIADDDDVELDELREEIANAAKQARNAERGAPTPRVVVYADTTLDYGCICPDFVLAPFYNNGSGGEFYPRYADGIPAASPTKRGLFRFAGHYTGKIISGFDWAGVPKAERKSPERENFAATAPEFLVEGWCFEPTDELEPDDLYVEQLQELASDGRFCAGATFPTTVADDE